MSERNVLLKRRVPSQRRGRDIPTDPFDTSGLLSALLPSAADDYAISSRLPHEHYLPGAMSHSGASLRRRQSESSHRRRRSDHQQAYAYADDPFTTTSSDEHEAQQSYRVGFDVPPSPPMVHSGNRRERRPTEWEIEERLRWRQELEDDALRGGGGERDLPYHHHRRDYSSHEHQPYPPLGSSPLDPSPSQAEDLPRCDIIRLISIPPRYTTPRTTTATPTAATRMTPSSMAATLDGPTAATHGMLPTGRTIRTRRLRSTGGGSTTSSPGRRPCRPVELGRGARVVDDRLFRRWREEASRMPEQVATNEPASESFFPDSAKFLFDA